MADETTLRIYRGNKESGQMVDYTVPVAPGMVVLDAIHEVQARHAPDLAVRWNCKAGRCRSCSAEVNGRDRKSTRLNSSHLGISYAVFCLKKKTKNYK